LEEFLIGGICHGAPMIGRGKAQRHAKATWVEPAPFGYRKRNAVPQRSGRGG